MRLAHVAFTPDSLTYTVTRALSACGHSVAVHAFDTRHAEAPSTGFWAKLASTQGVTVALQRAGQVDTGPFDRLIVQVFPRLLDQLAAVTPVARVSSRITLVTSGDRSRPWRSAIGLQLRELRQLRPWLAKVDRVVYKDGFHRLDLLGLQKPRAVVGFDVHSQFLTDPALFDLMHRRDWTAEAPRPIRANFVGSRDPAPRARIADSVRQQFLEPATDTGGTNKPMHWHEYSDAKPAGLDAQGFVDVLTQSDFTLCPLGYSLVTHRPMEALLRGSVPVIDEGELDLYALDLVDGRNCIAVRGGDWPAAVQRITHVAEHEVVAMRREIAGMFDKFLDYAASARRMCQRMGA